MRDTDAVDVEYAGENSHFWNEFGVEHQDSGAVGRGEHCYRCGGLGQPMAAALQEAKAKAGRTKGTANARPATRDGRRAKSGIKEREVLEKVVTKGRRKGV